MYLPKHFAMNSVEVEAVLSGAGVAQLVTLTASGLVASTLPLMYVPGEAGMGRLHGHVARANRMWKDALTSTEALVLFDVADAYVSPNAYPSKAENAMVVPTWNYISVHAYGTLVVHDDPVWTLGLVRRLTDRHEVRRAAARTDDGLDATPWSVDDAPTAYIDGMLKAIVGVEIVLTKVEGKAKLSQNKSAADALGVIDDLAHGDAGERAVMDAMIATTART